MVMHGRRDSRRQGKPRSRPCPDGAVFLISVVAGFCILKLLGAAILAASAATAGWVSPLMPMLERLLEHVGRELLTCATIAYTETIVTMVSAITYGAFYALFAFTLSALHLWSGALIAMLMGLYAISLHIVGGCVVLGAPTLVRILMEHRHRARQRKLRGRFCNVFFSVMLFVAFWHGRHVRAQPNDIPRGRSRSRHGLQLDMDNLMDDVDDAEGSPPPPRPPSPNTEHRRRSRERRRRPARNPNGEEEEDPIAIRLKLLPGGCPHCKRSPFYEGRCHFMKKKIELHDTRGPVSDHCRLCKSLCPVGFSSNLCCRHGKDKGEKLLEPLTPELAKQYNNPQFQSHAIQVNDFFGVSSIAVDGGRIYVGGGKESNEAPAFEKGKKRKQMPQSYKIKGTTSTRMIPPNAGGPHNPLNWWLSSGSYPAKEAKKEELQQVRIELGTVFSRIALHDMGPREWIHPRCPIIKLYLPKSVCRRRHA